jgi:hypothetical protein
VIVTDRALPIAVVRSCESVILHNFRREFLLNSVAAASGSVVPYLPLNELTHLPQWGPVGQSIQTDASMRVSLAGGVIYSKKRAVTDDDGVHHQNQLID